MKQIAIIGGGIAGLSAGCYGQMNGYTTRIFELHDKPGGLCTAWTRKGYTFDGCLVWLPGLSAGNDAHRIWRELGAVQNRKFHFYDVIQRVEGSDGRVLSIYSDIDRLEAHLKELSPADAAVIETLCDDARRFTPVAGMTVDGPSGLRDGITASLRMLPLLPVIQKYGTLSVEAFAARFGDPFLRWALTSFFDVNGGTDGTALTLVMMLAEMHTRNSGFPLGGSLEFARAIERRYLALGGEIRYRSRVEKILTEPGPRGRTDRAAGIRLADGTKHRADTVISAADGHATIFDMLEGRYTGKKIQTYYERLPVYESWIQVSLGVARDLSESEHLVSYPLDTPMDIAGRRVDRLDIRHYCYDPSMAPAGKSSLNVAFSSDQAYWKEGSRKAGWYKAEKKDIAAKVIEQLERRLPGIAGQIEVVDVSTPLTVERYTGNWGGSQEGWKLTPETVNMTMQKMEKTLPGLEDFYMAGQWVEPGGGVSTAAASGRNVIRRICRNDKRKFAADAADA